LAQSEPLPARTVRALTDASPKWRKVDVEAEWLRDLDRDDDLPAAMETASRLVDDAEQPAGRDGNDKAGLSRVVVAAMNRCKRARECGTAVEIIERHGRLGEDVGSPYSKRSVAKQLPDAERLGEVYRDR